MGAPLGSGLADMSQTDALIVVTMPPFARKLIKAAQQAHLSGAFVIEITDTHSCPRSGASRTLNTETDVSERSGATKLRIQQRWETTDVEKLETIRSTICSGGHDGNGCVCRKVYHD